MGKRPLETLCNLLEINRTSLFLITEMVTRSALLVEKKQSYGNWRIVLCFIVDGLFGVRRKKSARWGEDELSTDLPTDAICEHD